MGAPRRWRAGGLAGLLLGALVAPAPAAPLPPLALVFDTSGSMVDLDPRRYGVQLGKLLAVSVGGRAALSAWWSATDQCAGNAVTQVRLDPSDPAAFAVALDALPARGGNRFGAPLAAAADTLGGAPAQLVVLADGGGRSRQEQRAQADAEIARRVLAAGGRHADVDVRVSLLWNNLDDLDLHVVPPSGELIWFRHPRSRCGGALDVDRNANAQTRTREPVENVRWVRGQAPAGHYRVLVRNFAFEEAARAPIPFVVEIEAGGKVERHEGIASPNRETGVASEQLVAEFDFAPPPPEPPPDAATIAADLAAVDRALNPTDGGCPDPSAALSRLAGAGVGLRAITLGAAPDPFADQAPFTGSLRITTQAELLAAVADLAAGLGLTGALTGAGNGALRVPVPAHTGELWLLVSADGELAGLRPDPGNPSAAEQSLNAGGGRTLAADGRGVSSFRLLRVADPGPGDWAFSTGDGVPLGWLAWLRPALELKVTPPPVVLVGRDAPLAIEVRDPASGAPLADPARLAGLALTATFAGQPLALTATAPGRFAATLRADATGPAPLTVTLRHDGMTRVATATLNVGEAVWRLQPELPARARRELPLLVAARLLPAGPAAPHGEAPPTAVQVRGDGVEVRLNDAGADGDEAAGDGLYSAIWTPPGSGELALQMTGDGGAPTLPATVALGIDDWAALRGPARLDLGELTSGARPRVGLGLGGSDVRGAVAVEVSLSGVDDRLPVALVTAPDAKPLRLRAGAPVRVPLSGPPTDWALTVRVPRCPPRLVDGGGPATLRIATGQSGPEQELLITLALQTRPLPWWLCLLPWLLAALAVLAAIVIAWGFIGPARFPRTLGVVLSPEEDLEEGFFQLLRARQGTGASFYRDARACIGADFRVSGPRAGAVACLIAGRPRPRLKALSGQVLERRDADGDWTPLGPGETLAMTGVLYRTESGSLYFELRNA